MAQSKNPNPKGEDRSRRRSRASRTDLDQTRWRRELQASKVKFDEEAKQIFLEVLRETDRMKHSAMAAGVCLETVRQHIDNDPDFAEGVKEAKEQYRDRLREHVQSLIFEGVEEPIIGGKFKDTVVTHKRVFPTNLIAMEMRKTDPEYRDRNEIDVNVRGGVLVAPATMSPEEWQAQYGPRAQEPVTIDTTAEEVESE